MVLTPAVPPVRPQKYSLDQPLQIAIQAISRCQKSQASLLPKRLHSLAVSVLPQSHQDAEKLQIFRPCQQESSGTRVANGSLEEEIQMLLFLENKKLLASQRGSAPGAGTEPLQLSLPS